MVPAPPAAEPQPKTEVRLVPPKIALALGGGAARGFAHVGVIKALEAHGIVFDAETKRPKTNPETLESDRKGMYLAGVIVAGMHTHEIFIENGRFHGKQIASAIAAVLK